MIVCIFVLFFLTVCLCDLWKPKKTYELRNIAQNPTNTQYNANNNKLNVFRNMDLAIKHLNRNLYVLKLWQSIQQMISAKKYINALKSLNQIMTHHLPQLKEFTITHIIHSNIPYVTEKIKTGVFCV